MPLPLLLPVSDIHVRLQGIFPEGTANRNYVTREIAAKTIFVMLYVGAVGGTDRWLRPDQVTRMTDVQAAHLSSSALARVEILRRGAVAREGRVLVTFPSGETRDMEPGPSSVISKAVVEEFALRFLDQPGVIWLSESRNQVVARDDGLAEAIGLRIESDRNLPDAILIDLGPVDPVLVFVEVVATSGPISEVRKSALLAIATEAGFGETQVAFVTAYSDRDDPAFKRSVSELAWRSFAWFVSEPEHIIALHRAQNADGLKLSDLMD